MGDDGQDVDNSAETSNAGSSVETGARPQVRVDATAAAFYDVALSATVDQKRLEAALRRAMRACVSALDRIGTTIADPWSPWAAADARLAVPVARRPRFRGGPADRLLKDVTTLRRLAALVASADAAAALESLENVGRRAADARDGPPAWVESRDYDAALDAARRRAGPDVVETPPRWAALSRILADAEGRVAVPQPEQNINAAWSFKRTTLACQRSIEHELSSGRRRSSSPPPTRPTPSRASCGWARTARCSD